MIHGLLLRDATADDLDALAALEELCFTNPWPRKAFERELGTPFASVLLAIDPDDDELVGFVDYWRVEEGLHLLSVAVHPGHRRNGLGSHLLGRAEADGIEGGAALSVLEVRVGNAVAQALYRARGYGQVGVRWRYYSDTGEDALVLMKFLGGGP